MLIHPTVFLAIMGYQNRNTREVFHVIFSNAGMMSRNIETQLLRPFHIQTGLGINLYPLIYVHKLRDSNFQAGFQYSRLAATGRRLTLDSNLGFDYLQDDVIG